MKRTRRAPVVIEAARPTPAAGGALEGAERTTRETALWTPSMRSPDAAINTVKPMADARGRDMVANDGYSQGAVNIFRDSIVGTSYRLNAQPSWRVLSRYSKAFDETWAEEFQTYVEEEFALAAESRACWFDAQRRLTFTGLIRLGVASWAMAGETLATAEWIKASQRPFQTALQIISPDRLSNKDGASDDQFLRRGVQRDARGRPVAYHIRTAHPGDPNAGNDLWTWRVVPAETDWGRRQVIHIADAMLPDQSRGVAEMVAVLRHMRMTKTFQDIMLQNAVINATFAAAIESELPNEVVTAMLGNAPAGGAAAALNMGIGGYLEGLAGYLSNANNLQLDGAKIPHLYPGTKLNLKTAGTPGGVGTDFESSLLRHIAAGLNVSYEELSRDYSKTNYSSARAAMSNTAKSTQARKKFVADAMADDVYSLWLEEKIGAGDVPMPRGTSREAFYLPMAKEALCRATWIGAGRGQIDELKETQAAVLRISSGLSTFEDEIASLGGDWRRVFAQRKREQTLAETLNLVLSTDAQRPGQQDAGNTLRNSDAEDDKSQDKEDDL